MVPLYAAGALPVSFSPENTSVTTSDSAQTVAMKLQLEETLDIDYFVYHVICDSPIRLVSAVHGETQLGRDKTEMITLLPDPTELRIPIILVYLPLRSLPTPKREPMRSRWSRRTVVC